MESTRHPADRPQLRMLVVGSISGASLALAEWLRQESHASVAGPVPASAVAGALAAGDPPHVVIVDVDGLAVSPVECIAQLKHAAESPKVIVVACDGSDSLRRHCVLAGADAVFCKTTELGALANLLEVLENDSPQRGQSHPTNQ